MKKPAKATKVMVKSEEVAPADQEQIPTQCGICKKQFSDPTTARIHLDTVHGGMTYLTGKQ